MLFNGPSQWGDMSKFSLGQRMKASITGKHPNATEAPKNSLIYSDNMDDRTHIYQSKRGNTVLPTSMRPQYQATSMGTTPPPPPVTGE